MSGPPPLPETWTSVAEKAKEDGDWASLQFAALKILRDNETSPQGRNYLGIALGMQGEVEAGLAEHEKATRFAPDNPQWWHDHGVTLLRMGARAKDKKEALRYMREAEVKIEQALRVDPKYYHAYRSLLSHYISELEGDWSSGRGEDEVIALSNKIMEQFFETFGEGYPLMISLALQRQTGDVILKKPIVIEILRDGDDVVVQNDDLRIYGVGKNYQEANEEFNVVFKALYEEFVETSDPLSHSGQEYAEQLRLRGEGEA